MTQDPAAIAGKLSAAQALEGDALNSYFRGFYPSDFKDNWETAQCAGGYWRRYTGEEGRAMTIFPAVVCEDGFTFSAQGHFGAYSYPRDDFAERYDRVEILGPQTPEFGGGETCGDQWLYGYVPVETVNAVIEAHGGLSVRAILESRNA